MSTATKNGDQTVAELEYREYEAEARDGGPASSGPDVLVDVPVVNVDSIHLEVDELEANVSLQAGVLELLDLDVGVNVHVGKIRLDIKGVEAQALLKVRLDHVAAIVDRVMTTLDRNPEFVQHIGQAVEEIGSGAEETLEGVGDAEEQIGESAETEAGRLGQAAGSLAREIGTATTEEVKDLGAAASRRFQAIGERRRRKRAEKHDATPAAMRLAEELGVDISDIDGTGADGRIVVGDVRGAAEED